MTILLQTITDDIASIKTIEDNVVAAKKQLTGLLTSYVALFNNQATPRATLVASLTAYINQYDLLTAQTNALRTATLKLVTDIQPAVANLSDAQLTALMGNRAMYLANAYALIANILVQYGQADALTLADYVHSDLVKDINATFAKATRPPATIIFNTTDALGIAISKPPAPTPPSSAPPTLAAA